MEEDIKVLEEFINNYKLIQEKYKDDEIQAEIERSCYFEEVPAKAIENLIKGYKELEEKAKLTMEVIGANYISKDKIKEKIKYIEENYSEHSEFSIGKSIEFLQELLEERK